MNVRDFFLFLFEKKRIKSLKEFALESPRQNHAKMSVAMATAQVTESQSLAATQNLLAALVSELCYARNIFQQDGESHPSLSQHRGCLPACLPAHPLDCESGEA